MVRIFVLIFAFLIIWLYLDFSGNEPILIGEEGGQPEVDFTIGEEENANDDLTVELPDEGLMTLMGQSSKAVEAELGEPDRIDPSFEGYDWWIYNVSKDEYIQVGILENKVVTVFATGDKVDIEPFQIGQPSGEIYSSLFAETNIEIEHDGSVYRFELSEADLNMRPIVRIGDYFALLYLDKFTGTLSSVRLLDSVSLILLRPYEMVYRGELLVFDDFTEDEKEAINNGMEQQIKDISNVIRKRFDLNPLEWDDKTAEVALGHSIDMFESEAFSHTSEKYGELSDRLKAEEVAYLSAGENIAANYVDAPAVVEGWLNSKGHRDSLLNEQFTHIGVGVYEKQYTQNFIEKWGE
ncbi:CAP domain-containing protein [Cytobacillus horneckiae]|uniref:CAP domain-containing protein n=1 Tax=Cytobacillus horneckiae TaxID=549687 RepID=UPI001F4E2FD0|nr:CAP domain-containing protein [Cytobacillus horneckiae]MEC1156877.1 CAP domain-containing protein [Cytobacillus horneckiae]MED2940476.1 CAP domain-containing protein [Cytobacillus horneckiae]